VRLSFRDPDGFVFRSQDRIFRCVFAHAAQNLRAFLPSGIATTWMSESVLAATAVISVDSGHDLLPDLREELRKDLPRHAVILEHEPIPFPNYPYEWPPEMLHAAGNLTVRLARESLDDGFGLKDATPYNIMFDGPRPVFIDILSFEKRDSLDTLWRPYAQFVRSFVYPLLAARYGGVRIDELLLVHRDGIEPQRMLGMLPGWRRWMPPFLAAVTIPALLSRKDRDAGTAVVQARDTQEAKFVMARRLRKAERLLAEVPSRPQAFEYMKSGRIYSETEWDEKQRVITETLERYRPVSVLDVGCNIGHFSSLAARMGARVVAIDHDPDAVGVVWKTAVSERLSILPLVVNIARPPGACGWSNAEFAGFLDRARGKFDCVLMLALLHHLLVNERVPLDSIFDLAASLTTRLLIVEYIDPADPQFRSIARGRDALHRDLTADSFEFAARRLFEIAGTQAVTPTRRIYTLEKRRV
jgi:SAM-dependent methyltransferase